MTNAPGCLTHLIVAALVIIAMYVLTGIAVAALYLLASIAP